MYHSQRLRGLGFMDNRFDQLVPTVLQEYFGAGLRANIDLVQIALNVWQTEQPVVHNPEPEPRYVGKQVDAEVTVRQLRQVLEMSQ